MYISKSLEKFEAFGRFVKEHDVSPRLAVYAIQCCNEMRRSKGFKTKHEWKQKAIGFLITMGFDNIEFVDEWPTFTDKTGLKTSIPKP